MRPTSCPNLNHRRSNSPVRFCPKCGEVVNASIPVKRCSDTEHARKRREMEAFCIDCGTQLIT